MPDSTPPHGAAPAAPVRDGVAPSALAPLFNPAYRMLWGIWLAANVCMWMSDVAAASMMTALTASPLWVALVQSASTLPMFLLGLPSGALADILDRRRYFFLTQVWVAGVALLLCAAVLARAMTPPLLLALTCANGVGLAMRFPVFAAIVPDVVPRAQLPAALALNGVAMNASRIAGPLIAGALMAAAGGEYVFVLNAALSALSGFFILRWRHVSVASPLGREPLLGAMRVGVQFVRQSAPVKAALLRTAIFYFHAIALLALLPLIARALRGSHAGSFTLLLAAMGGGAIAAAILLPRLRRVLAGNALVAAGTALHSLAMIAVACGDSAVVAAPAMFFAGLAWIIVANTVTVSVQLALPDWVRARGMSVFQMTMMGASALGAALWGGVASLAGVSASVLLAAVCGTVAMLAANRLAGDPAADADLTPAPSGAAPRADPAPAGGRLQQTIEYRIDPARAAQFRALMRESRRAHLGQGALSWDLLCDIADPGRYIERIVDPSWIEHLRRLERVTTADAALRARQLAYHLGPHAPIVTRSLIAEQ